MGGTGLEPVTFRTSSGRSAIELTAHGARGWIRTIDPHFIRVVLLPLSYARKRVFTLPLLF